MAVQNVNTYAFNVKRISLMMPQPLAVTSPTGVGPSFGAGMSAYEGEQVYVVATSLANAQATLVAQYSTDLGPVSGGAALVPGAITQLA